MPRLASGLATRARRPRPSEKTPSASSPTFPRTAIHAGLVPPGGAGSARPQGKARGSPGHAPVRPPGVRLRIGSESNALAFVQRYDAGAQSAPLICRQPTVRRLREYPVRGSILWVRCSPSPPEPSGRPLSSPPRVSRMGSQDKGYGGSNSPCRGFP